WRRAAALLTLPVDVLRLARLARDADLLYACTLSSFPYCFLAGRLARRPQLVHVYSSYGDAAPYRKHLLGRARHVVAPSADSLALADSVHTTGFLANPFPLVRTLDVLVHPARRDPFPLALLEGMALARPIVAAAVGGIPEMLVDGESGVLVPTDDAPALARAIVTLLRDPATRARLGAAAHRRLVTRFSLAGFAADMFQAFDDAVADGVG